MTTMLPRDLLEKAFPGQPRTQRAFESISQTVEETSGIVALNLASTGAIQDATVVTLSSNQAFNNERILTVGSGLSITEDGTNVTLSISEDTAAVSGGYRVTLAAQAPSLVFVPIEGTLATREGQETLLRKTLDAPSLSGLGDYADDAAAASGGVPVGGVYRNGSALMVRVT